MTSDEDDIVDDDAGEGHDVDALVAAPELDAARLTPDDDRPAVGSWWWARASGSRGESEYDRPGKLWLACVVEVGSNYAKIEGIRFGQRIALDDFHQACTSEPNPSAFIDEKVDGHKKNVRALMGKIEAICRRLGVPMRQALDQASQSSSQALAVVHGVSNAKKYKRDLIRAKEKTLPELFAKVKEEHKQMATWMKAELIPAEATLSDAKKVVEVIDGKIGTVELYAGLVEELVCVREGGPAGIDERVRIMQRMHYMDEECLAKYEAGGMDFKDVHQFDAWLSREENFGRIFTSRRCIVAFRIRRHSKNYGDLNAFISFHFNEANKQTFLYIRNGDQLHRMTTDIDFGAELFPDKQSSALLGDQELWILEDESELEGRHSAGDLAIISRQQRDAMIDYHRQKRHSAARKLWQWHRAGKPEGTWTYVAGDDADILSGVDAPGDSMNIHGKPYGSWHGDNLDYPRYEKYRLLTPENIYHDDAMRRIQRTALEHNRVAVIVQGLLDRSTCLHPHPPWRIWTADGFVSGIDLSYDVSRVIAPGEAPDFEAYRRQLNHGIRAGCHTLGQHDAWRQHMHKRHGDKWWYHQRWGDGPDKIDRVERVLRSGACEFRWKRRQVKPKWVRDPDNPGFLKATYPELPCSWVCPAEVLTCVDAYTPGDFHMFYDDPRTRADYLQWAPILLACEDWHAKRRAEQQEQEQAPRSTRQKKRRGRS